MLSVLSRYRYHGQLIWHRGLRFATLFCPVFIFLFALVPSGFAATTSPDKARRIAINIPLPPKGSELIQMKRALGAGLKEDWPAWQERQDKITDPFYRKLLLWQRLTSRYGHKGFAELSQFMADNSHWPYQKRLQFRAEMRMPNISSRALIKKYRDTAPLSSDLKFKYAEALFKSGKKKAAKQAFQSAWVHGRFSKDRIKIYLEKYGDHLGETAHIARLKRILWLRRAARNIQHMLPLVPENYRAYAKVRLAFTKRRKNAMALYDKLDKELQKDQDLLYDRTRWLRRHKKYEEARDLFLSLKETPQARADIWWRERRLQVRYWLAKGNTQAAYALARSHKQEPDSRAYAEAEWHAGWLALRFLKQGKRARDHFRRFEKVVKYPISRARAYYWLARSEQKLGDETQARNFYRMAAQFGHTYYGQLATETLGRSISWRLDTVVPLSEKQTTRFEAREMVRALRLLHRVNLPEMMRPFLLRLAWSSKDPIERQQISALAQDINQPWLAVRAGKVGALRLDPPTTIGHPVVALKAMTPRVKVEPALVHALIRQESEFRARVKSHVGARGLMQIMPRTGQRLAKSLNVPYARQKLLDPEYNMRLGTKYLADLIERYSGSYIMAIAAYNAGEHRVDRWLVRFGDPRTNAIDAIDWMEKIPFYETRNYVQRVMENLQIYRYKMAQANTLTITPSDHDLSLTAVLVQPQIYISNALPTTTTDLQGLPIAR